MSLGDLVFRVVFVGVGLWMLLVGLWGGGSLTLDVVGTCLKRNLVWSV